MRTFTYSAYEGIEKAADAWAQARAEAAVSAVLTGQGYIKVTYNDDKVTLTVLDPLAITERTP